MPWWNMRKSLINFLAFSDFNCVESSRRSKSMIAASSGRRILLGSLFNRWLVSFSASLPTRIPLKNISDHLVGQASTAATAASYASKTRLSYRRSSIARVASWLSILSCMWSSSWGLLTLSIGIDVGPARRKNTWEVKPWNGKTCHHSLERRH